MIDKEISEIKRRFKKEYNNINFVRGCYVDNTKQIVSQFKQSITLMPEEESEFMLSVLKKTLSGTIGKNLIDINFSTQQVVDSDEHRLLMSLRNTGLDDDEVVQTFFDKVINSIEFEESYLILLACDKYDVPYKGKDGFVDNDNSQEVFKYIICSICPVKMTKPALSYKVKENEFKNSSINWLVSLPKLGFMFPAFDDRSSNIYNALHYTKDTKMAQENFIREIFNTQAPIPATIQKEIFNDVLAESLDKDCNFETLQLVHDKVSELVITHKESKAEEPLTLSKTHIKSILSNCGVSDENIEEFDGKFDIEFGKDVDVYPKNIIDINKFSLKTADVSINVNPERTDLIQTKIIDGSKYVMVRIEEDVEINGVSVKFFEEN